MKSIAAALILVCPAIAHDLYLMPERFIVEPGTRVSVAFHNGDGFPDSEVAPRVERMLNPRAISSAGEAPIENLRVDGNALRAEAVISVPGSTILAVQTKPNLIELSEDKFISYLQHEGLRHVIDYRNFHGEKHAPGRERYSKYAKALMLSGGPTALGTKPVGFPVEIIPLRNPYELRLGDTLPVQVIVRGKPAQDLQVEIAWVPAGAVRGEKKIAGRTDAEGRLQFPVDVRGIWRVHTIWMERCKEPTVADWESFWASMTFELR